MDSHPGVAAGSRLRRRGHLRDSGLDRHGTSGLSAVDGGTGGDREFHECRYWRTWRSDDPRGAAANLPPVISTLDPSSAAAGQQVTIHGTNFGATQADPNHYYVFFVDGGTSWGAPFDGATFQINSWSDTAITFTVPTPSGPGGIWHVSPGDTATVTVNTSAGPSNAASLQITG